MAEYGFTINVAGNSIQQLKAIEAELGRLGVIAKDTGRNAAESLAPMENKLQDIGRKLAELFAIREVFNFGKEILNVTAEFEGFENRIRFASLNSWDASKNLSFLREEIEKLHIPMRQAYEGFSEMEAGLVGTGIQGQRLRDLFEGISTAAATLHLPEFQLQRTLYDLKEIGEIGINMRVARSLGTALPGINSIVKETFGKSLRELEGSISGGEFLAKLGPALKAHFEGGLAAWGESLQAKLADMKNAATTTMLKIGDNLRPIFSDILTNIRDAFSSAPVQFFVTHATEVVKILGYLVGMFLAYQAVVKGTAAAEWLLNAATSAMTVIDYTAAFGVEGLTFALESLGVSIATLGLTIGAFSLAVMIQGFLDLQKQVEDSLEDLTHFKEVEASFNQGTKVYEGIFDRVKTAALHGSSKEEKSELLTDALSAQKQLSDEITKTLKPGVMRAEAGLTTDLSRFKHPDSEYAQRQTADTRQKLLDATNDFAAATKQLERISRIINNLKGSGVKPVGNVAVPGLDAAGLHGSHLAGAEGGLNQARIVNLKIEKVMEVHEAHGPDLVKHAEHAADFIVRAMDNLSESKSGTF